MLSSSKLDMDSKRKETPEQNTSQGWGLMEEHGPPCPLGGASTDTFFQQTENTDLDIQNTKGRL